MVLAAVAALLGASVQSATGFGFALVLSPALFAVLDPYEAVGALLVLGFALNLLVLYDGRRPVPVRWGALAPLLIAALPGLAAGVALLEVLPKAVLQVAVGAAVLAAGGWQLRRRVAGRQSPVARSEPRRRVGALVGLTSGALTTSISVSGPPIVLWLESQGLGPAELRATLAAAFLVLNAVGAGALLAAGGVGQAVPLDVLLPLLALIVVGHLVGARAFRRLDQRRFYLAVLALVAISGAASLVAGLVAL
jgi:uncharacterized membrane protein YfcA